MLTFPSGLSYIGLTTETTAIRFARHKREVALGKTTCVMHNAWRKYGPPNTETLAIVEVSDLPSLEIRAIRAFGTLMPNGYNMVEGGQTSPSKSPLVKAKISKALKGRPARLDNIEALRVLNTGRKWTDEQRAALSLSRMGRQFSEETRRKISEAKKGICTVSKEHLARMTVLAAAKKPSTETIAKRKASLQANEGYRKNMSIAITAMWARRRAAQISVIEET